jgi:hypothetical protein
MTFIDSLGCTRGATLSINSPVMNPSIDLEVIMGVTAMERIVSWGEAKHWQHWDHTNRQMLYSLSNEPLDEGIAR